MARGHESGPGAGHGRLFPPASLRSMGGRALNSIGVLAVGRTHLLNFPDARMDFKAKCLTFSVPVRVRLSEIHPGTEFSKHASAATRTLTEFSKQAANPDARSNPDGWHNRAHDGKRSDARSAGPCGGMLQRQALNQRSPGARHGRPCQNPPSAAPSWTHRRQVPERMVTTFVQAKSP